MGQRGGSDWEITPSGMRKNATLRGFSGIIKFAQVA
jgi:hypothetical protein